MEPAPISVCKYCGAPPSSDKSKWEQVPICKITNNMRLKKGWYQLDWVTKRHFFPKCERCHRAQKKGWRLAKRAMIIALLPAALVGVGGSIVFDTRMAFAGIAVWFVAFSLLAVIMSKLSDIDHPEKDPEIAKDARQRLYDKGWEFGRVPSLEGKTNFGRLRVSYELVTS